MANAKCFPRCPALPPTYVCVEMVTVKAGDTLYSISEEYDVPVPILMQANKILNPYNLKIGRRICIPGPVPENPVCVGIVQTVVPTDTLYKISRQYNIELQAILKANPTLDPYNMQIGQKLCIPTAESEIHLPEAGSDISETENQEPAEQNAVSAPLENRPEETLREEILDEVEDYYEVKDGDDLDSILRTLRITLESLLRANPNLCLNELLETGTKLFLPR